MKLILYYFSFLLLFVLVLGRGARTRPGNNGIRRTGSMASFHSALSSLRATTRLNLRDIRFTDVIRWINRHRNGILAALSSGYTIADLVKEYFKSAADEAKEEAYNAKVAKFNEEYKDFKKSIQLLEDIFPIKMIVSGQTIDVLQSEFNFEEIFHKLQPIHGKEVKAICVMDNGSQKKYSAASSLSDLMAVISTPSSRMALRERASLERSSM